MACVNSFNSIRGVAALVLGLALSACGSSSPSGTAGKAGGRWQESWTGGPFQASNPLVNAPPARACPAETSGTPVCHYHRITPAPGTKYVLVAIEPETGFEADDYDLAVYDEHDVIVAVQADADGREAVVFPTNGSAYYEVRVQPYTVALNSGYRGVATETDQAIDAEPACDLGVLSGEEYPVAIGVPGVTDQGQEIELSVAVLLDGVDEALARAVMARAADAYSPHGIKLTVAGVQASTIASNVSAEIIQQAKDQTGGAPPFGADIAAVFTNREMQSATGGAGTVLGQADCIGGIRAPYNSYLVATIEAEDPFELVPGVWLDVERGPETMAHEIGHLMGAHHHYGNCVEGMSPEDAERGDVSPCDLMFPSVEPLSLVFGTLEAATVRGHAVEYAAP